MYMRNITLRINQLIFGMGPGSIVETQNGSILISSPEIGLNQVIQNGSIDIIDFIIDDPMISQYLGGAKLLQVPSNKEADKSENFAIYRNQSNFPEWSICSNHQKIFKANPNEQHPCKDCNKSKIKFNKYNSIRFIQLCKKGHIDDINWNWIAHGFRSNSCDENMFTWRTSHKRENIIIKCDLCDTSGKFGEYLYKKLQCRGIYFFNKIREENCEETPTVELKNSIGVYLPLSIKSVTVPPFDNPEIRIIIKNGIYEYFKKQPLENFDKIIGQIKDDLEKPMIKNTIKYVDKVAILNFLKKQNNEINEIFNQYSQFDELKPIEDPSYEEMDELVRKKEIISIYSAINTGNIGMSYGNQSNSDFIINKNNINEFTINKFNFEITPIEKLRVLFVLKGFKRGYDGDEVPLNFKFHDDDYDDYYLSTENIGEGIFIKLWSEPINLISKKELNKWQKFLISQNISPNNFNDKINHIWYHTIAHRLIRGLSLYSGYSSSSITEKIYSETINDNHYGGILLYTSGSTGDGTLGGLSSSVNKFKEILNHSLEDITDCSNNPLCEEQLISEKRPIGAACYTCLFVSETSCESNNKLLDRHIIDW